MTARRVYKATCLKDQISMSALTTPSSWIIQSINLEELPVDDLSILLRGLFHQANCKFEPHGDSAIVLKLPYSTREESILQKLGDWAECIRVVHQSVFLRQDETVRFLELIQKRKVTSSPEPAPDQRRNDQPGPSRGGHQSPAKRFKRYT